MILDKNTPSARDRGRSPSLAASFSFLWPGLGQLYVGNRRLAALFAVPALLILLILAYQLRQGVVVFAARFADPAFSLTAIVIVVVAGVWRLASVLNAFRAGEHLKTRRVIDRAAVVALAAVIVISHLVVGGLLLDTYNAGSAMFNPDISRVMPAESLAPGETPGSTLAPLPTPVPGGRVTILFIAGSTQGALYDSIMVVSYDPKTNSVQMVSVPRDTGYVPLYFGGVFPYKINYLAESVGNGVLKSPEGKSRAAGLTTFIKEVSYLVGIPINYYANMDVNGFVKMIDAVGGIDVVNPKAITDPTYDWLDNGRTPYGFYLSAGPHALNGKQALAYVRSRHTFGDYDWGRDSRQQEVLVDLLHKMAQPSEIPAIPGLISTIGSSISTDFPANQVADYVAMGQSVSSGDIKHVVLGPPYEIPAPAAMYCLLNDKLAALSIGWFGTESTWYGKPAPAITCP
jgi:LCP family protein required for cell wall assembly